MYHIDTTFTPFSHNYCLTRFQALHCRFNFDAHTTLIRPPLCPSGCFFVYVPSSSRDIDLFSLSHISACILLSPLPYTYKPRTRFTTTLRGAEEPAANIHQRNRTKVETTQPGGRSVRRKSLPHASISKGATISVLVNCPVHRMTLTPSCGNSDGKRDTLCSQRGYVGVGFSSGIRDFYGSFCWVIYLCF